MAFSPERLYSGAVFAQPRHLPEARGRDRAGILPARGRVLRLGARRGDRGDELRRGRRVQQDRGHDVPRRQHRPGQRLRPLRRPRGRGHPGSDRRRPTASPTRTSTSRASAWAATAFPSTRTCSCSRAPDLEVVAVSRRTNDAQVGLAIKSLEGLLGGLDDVPVLVLGLTYRDGVKELAYSRALPLIERLSFHGAEVYAYDPLLSDAEIEHCCATPYHWGERAPIRAIVTQTADGLWDRDRLLALPGPRGCTRRPQQPARGRTARRGPLPGHRRPGGHAPAIRCAGGTGTGPLTVRIVSVVGTRPQLIKAAALQPALERDHTEIFVDTGQHYDEAMAGSFFPELGLTRPDHSLGLGGGGHGDQTGRMLIALEPLLRDARPGRRPRLRRHQLDAGRSAGRVQARHPRGARGGRPAQLRPRACRRSSTASWPITLATWLFAPDRGGRRQSRGRGDHPRRHRGRRPDAGSRRARLRPRSATRPRWRQWRSGWSFHSIPGSYLFATVHRAENRTRDAMAAWAALLGAVAAPDRPVVLALHPGTRAALARRGHRNSPSECSPSSRRAIAHR